MSRTALIVDDNQALAEDLGEILESEGFVVRVFFDPLRAMEGCGAQTFDVALFDVRMPGMDGVELYRALVGGHPRTLFILMSAYADDARLRQALTEGVHLVLPKPLSVPRLLEAVAASPEPGV
jgi:CheY-like chemotaxis protein